MAAKLPVRYAALAIDSDMGARMRLKQAATSMHQIKSITLYADIQEAIKSIEYDPKFIDVVFISNRLPEMEAKNFIMGVKAVKHFRDAAFVQLLISTEDEDAQTTQSILNGYDGVLMEPYSVDALLNIVELTARIKKERREKREKDAISYLIQNIIKKVDRMAYIRASHMDIGTAIKRLKASCHVFESFDEANLNAYYEAAVEMFGNAVAYGDMHSKQQMYKGVSQRIRKIVIKKMLEEEAAEDKDTEKSDIFDVWEKDDENEEAEE